ncbi:peptidoglycan DD-metalloendopeptidase family protein [Phototrophicus methaneseepsis]|uniref:Peptidoglycan DD-metalloendopeptidase family protein n=1 Tax=Phototrophicus methaneseepsis TaxID=2710758 RepID=A0A7S8E914_9CHLR|nr:peptidoglycan DD-metalloendopeptidase family protein [Phototrophicus methaneseepsis]QPC82616.1 peptidoglycan DD-metalloendopeptidase family protein [Phototrophicus methaneseepsis]
MNSLADLIMGFIRGILGQSSNTMTATTPTDEAECSLGFHEIPATVDTSDVPTVGTLSTMGGSVTTASAANNCVATVRPELGTVNVRSGPRIGFFPVGKTSGGATFTLAGASEPDENGYRWYQVTYNNGSGWIRSDLINLSDGCRQFSFISDADYPDPATPVTTRFPLPTTARITNNYSRTSHPGLDFGTPLSTPIFASATGTVIRRIQCERCTDTRPNIYPCGQNVYNDEKWGFGYGNFVVVRHDYAVMPAPLRELMDDANLTGGFVYVLYAHFQQLFVDLGNAVNATTLLGHTGNHGCSTGPHIHIEIRMGKVEIVDGHWLQQTSVNPNLFFTI